jgi:hypothetical protein
VSPREEVTKARLQVLLESLGREFRRPARLFLSGGEGLVWRGLRAATRDVDITYEVDPAYHAAWMGCLVALKERLRLSIEEAGPGDFIPLPPGHEARASSVGRFGTVDVLLFDPYSVALSKLDRGHARDIEDVRSLLKAGVLDPGELRRLFEAVQPAYATRSLKSDPARFRRGLEAALASGPP